MSSATRVLLVDGDPAARESFRAAISRLGYEVDTAASVSEARERMARDDYAAAFVEIRLPDGSGLDLIRQGEETSAAPPEIVTARRPSLRSSLQAINRGARGYITKPYQLDEIRARTEAAIQEFEGRMGQRRALDSARERAEFYERLAMVDSLTGLFNDRYFRSSLRREVEAARRYARALSLLVIDVDHFKRFNDLYGHAAGDHCLSHVGRVLRRSARDADIVARWGGEEFAAILPQTPARGAARCARRMLQAVASSPPPPSEGRALPTLTVSIGYATYPDAAADADSLFQEADAALYEAKRAGRNGAVGAGLTAG